MLLSCLHYSAAVNNIHSNYQGKPQTYSYGLCWQAASYCNLLKASRTAPLESCFIHQTTGAKKNRNSLCGWESNDIRSTELVRVLTVLGDANASLHKRLPRYKSAHTWCFHLKKLVTEL